MLPFLGLTTNRPWKMKIVALHLQKKPDLASNLVQTYKPDMLLAQEFSLATEPVQFRKDGAHYTSKLGYGTAIWERKGTCPSNHE